MSQIVGVIKTSFRPKDSETPIEGITVHTTDPILPERGNGLSTDRFFISSRKMKELPFTPAVGQEVEVLFNRWGKVATLRLINTEID